MCWVQKEHPKMKSIDTKIRKSKGVKRCKIEIYIYKCRKTSQKIQSAEKIRGLKGTSEDISISRRKQSQKVQDRTESKDTKKPQSNCTQEKNPRQKCTREEKNPSPNAQEKPQSSSQKVQEESRLKGANQSLCNSRYTSLPPPSQNYLTVLPTVI